MNYNERPKCESCASLPKVYHVGARTITNESGDRVKVTRWCCEEGHIWATNTVVECESDGGTSEGDD